MKRKIIISIACVCVMLSVFTIGFVTGSRMQPANVSATMQNSDKTQAADTETEWIPTESSFATDNPETSGDNTTATPKREEKKQSTPATPIDPIPSTIAEIVACFNQAANKIKEQRPAVYQTRDRLYIASAEFGKKDLTSMLEKMNRDDRSKKEILPVSYPVGGAQWASKLTADAVSKAECELDGGTIKLALYLKSEGGVPLRGKSNHGSCMSIPGDFDFLNFDIPGIKLGDISLTYAGCFITCSIEQSTGNMLASSYHIRAQGAIPVTLAAIIKKECSAQIESDSDYSMEW